MQLLEGEQKVGVILQMMCSSEMRFLKWALMLLYPFIISFICSMWGSKMSQSFIICKKTPERNLNSVLNRKLLRRLFDKNRHVLIGLQHQKSVLLAHLVKVSIQITKNLSDNPVKLHLRAREAFQQSKPTYLT